MRISTWFEALIMHNIRSQWLLNIESIFFAGSLLVVMFSLTSFNASSRSEKSFSLEFSIFKHSDPKKPIGKSSELISETRHILTTPSSMFRYFEFLVSSRSENVISKLCPLLRQCNGRMSIFQITLLKVFGTKSIIWIFGLYKMIVFLHALMRDRNECWVFVFLSDLCLVRLGTGLFSF